MLEKINTRIRIAGPGDAATLKAWMSDKEFIENFYEMPVSDAEKMEKEVKALIKVSSEEISDKRLFIVETDSPMGLVFLHDIDLLNKTLYFSVIVGEEGKRNMMFGLKLFADALKLLFEQMGMHKVKGLIYGFNVRAIRLVEAFGARKEGILRDYVKRNGVRHNAIIYAFFRKDYPAFLKKIENY